jgi:hypothetical protein
MCWSHADETTYLQWISESGIQVHWNRFIPEGESGHTLVFGQKPPVDKSVPLCVDKETARWSFQCDEK